MRSAPSTRRQHFRLARPAVPKLPGVRPSSAQGRPVAVGGVRRRWRWEHRAMAATDEQDQGGYPFGPSRFWWIPSAILLVTFFVAAGFSPAAGSRSFYEAAAQVIPVIMLTLAIEARAFEWTLEWRGWRDRWSRGLDGYVVEAVARVAVLVGLIVAQIITMAQLADAGALARPQPKFVFGVMVTGLAAVVVFAVPRRATK